MIVLFYSYLTETPIRQALCQLTVQEGLRQSTPPWAFNNKSILTRKKEIYEINLEMKFL